MDCGDRNLDAQALNNIQAGVATATEVFVSVPTQGDTQFTRQGREITNVEVEWRWDGVVGVGETGASPVSLRIIIDTQPNGVSVLGSLASTMYVTDQISGFENIDWEQRFFEADRCDFDCIGASAGAQPAWQAQGGFNAADKIKFHDNAGGSATVCGDWAMYALVYQNGGLTKNTADTLNFRMRFQVE